MQNNRYLQIKFPRGDRSCEKFGCGRFMSRRIFIYERGSAFERVAEFTRCAGVSREGNSKNRETGCCSPDEWQTFNNKLAFTER